ncbi:MAG: hypothetical protein ACOYD6_00450 [Limnochordia bacterium]|jgi:hypothetical protein
MKETSVVKPQLFGDPDSLEAIASFLMLTVFAFLMWVLGPLSFFAFLVLLAIYLFLWLLG